MQKKYIKLILPVVAILVILQSVMIVENLNKGKKEANVVIPVNPAISETSLPTKVAMPSSVVIRKPAEISVQLKAPAQMQVGKSYQVEVYLNGITAVKPLTLETYVGFDPSLVKVSNLKTSQALPRADFSKIDSTKGVVVSNFLLSQEINLVPGQQMLVESFTVTPNQAGQLTFNVLDNQSEKTLFVESGTARTIPFAAAPLVVNVGR